MRGLSVICLCTLISLFTLAATKAQFENTKDNQIYIVITTILIILTSIPLWYILKY